MLNSRNLKIVFMGTPEFSVFILKALVEQGYQVVGVVTAPDKPSGRGLKLQESEVKKYALQQNLKVLQPEKLKSDFFLNELKELNADLQIVVAFRMLPEPVWQMPPLGTFNLHASLLPQYRGAAPINHAIINGEIKTGLTTFFIDKEIDTGRIILQQEIEIKNSFTAGDLHDIMMVEGARLVLETIERIASGNTNPLLQSELSTNLAELKSAPKISKDDCRIDWKKEGTAIYNFIRGMNPYPGAWSVIRNSQNDRSYIIKIFECEFDKGSHTFEPGTIITSGKLIQVSVSGGFIALKTLQLEGKKKLKSDEFLRGFSFENYTFV